MKILANQNVFNIFRKTLNLVDYRLVDHGERVSYIVLKMMQAMGGFSELQMARCCVLAVLHDVGAYKTEEINFMTNEEDLLKFEQYGVEEHAAYGYLFLRNFSALRPGADAILYHHVPYTKLMQSECKNKLLAAAIFAADRYDLLLRRRDKQTALERIYRKRGKLFSPEIVQYLIQVEEEIGLAERLESDEYLEELFSFIGGVEFLKEELLDFLKLLAYVIDYRSPHTVTHTITTAAISAELARLLQLPEEESEALNLGAFLHDLGKIATPLDILEKPGKLTPYEYAVMKEHVAVTEQILDGCVSDIIVQIAIRHHEKLDGSGYHRGLSEKDLTMAQMALAVADMTSALMGRRSYKDAMAPDVVKRILLEEVEGHKINGVIVQTLISHYDEIFANVQRETKTPLENYKNIQEQFPDYVRQLHEIRAEQYAATYQAASE